MDLRMPAWALALVACGSSHAKSPDAASDGPVDAYVMPDAYIPHESHALGLNDISILLQLPPDPFWPTLVTLTGFPNGGDLVPRDLFAHLVTDPGDVTNTFEQFQLVAIRFDLCDRVTATACPAGADGRMRLVFQPIEHAFYGTFTVQADEVAVHAFYPIPANELAPLVDELRALASLYDFQTDSPLAINQGVNVLDPPTAYSRRLAALVERYAIADHLVRLSLFAQDARQSQPNYVFRASEKVNGAFQDFAIPTIGSTQQRVIPYNNSWTTSPVADVPAGLQLALQQSAFDAAPYAQRIASLGALAQALNPQAMTFSTEQCVNCHAGEAILDVRAADVGVDPTTVSGTFTSTHSLSTQFGRNSTIRGFGWSQFYPAISQRVANESALVLDEMNHRFPPALPASQPDAGVIDAPPNVKRVFVTDFVYNADLRTLGNGSDGLDGADRLCAAGALHGHLGGQWQAWLSTSTVNAIDHLSGNGPWYLVDGTTLVFADKASIPAHPMHPIDHTELGAVQNPNTLSVWTGTHDTGLLAGTSPCADFTSASNTANAMTGASYKADQMWTESFTTGCNAQLRLYCFEI